MAISHSFAVTGPSTMARKGTSGLAITHISDQPQGRSSYGFVLCLSSIRALEVEAFKGSAQKERPRGESPQGIEPPRKDVGNCKFPYRYLPSYSPDLNPIEPAWAQVK